MLNKPPMIEEYESLPDMYNLVWYFPNEKKAMNAIIF